jgi:bacillaene synthase trans-acting acyltransferase
LGSLNSQNEYIYVDLGPSGTLANFARQNLGNGKASSVFSTITQFNNGMNNLAQLRERINRI